MSSASRPAGHRVPGGARRLHHRLHPRVRGHDGGDLRQRALPQLPQVLVGDVGDGAQVPAVGAGARGHGLHAQARLIPVGMPDAHGGGEALAVPDGDPQRIGEPLPVSACHRGAHQGLPHQAGDRHPQQLRAPLVRELHDPLGGEDADPHRDLLGQHPEPVLPQPQGRLRGGAGLGLVGERGTDLLVATAGLPHEQCGEQHDREPGDAHRERQAHLGTEPRGHMDVHPLTAGPGGRVRAVGDLPGPGLDDQGHLVRQAAADAALQQRQRDAVHDHPRQARPALGGRRYVGRGPVDRKHQHEALRPGRCRQGHRRRHGERPGRDGTVGRGGPPGVREQIHAQVPARPAGRGAEGGGQIEVAHGGGATVPRRVEGGDRRDGALERDPSRLPDDRMPGRIRSGAEGEPAEPAELGRLHPIARRDESLGAAQRRRAHRHLAFKGVGGRIHHRTFPLTGALPLHRDRRNGGRDGRNRHRAHHEGAMERRGPAGV